MKKQLLIIIAVVCALSGCKLDEAGFNQKSANTSGLLLGMWFIKTQVQVDPVLGTTTYTGFTTDDYYLFNSDKTVKISYSYPAVIGTGTYTYDSGSKTLNITGGGETDVYTVNKLTADSLIITTTISATVGSNTSTSTLTYKLTH